MKDVIQGISRVAFEGETRVALLQSDHLRLLSRDWNVDNVLHSGGSLESLLDAPPEREVFAEEATFLPPVERPRQIFAIGVNYKEHADEADEAVPPVPLVFAKLRSSLTGHSTPIRLRSQISTSVDYEAELALVLGAVSPNGRPSIAGLTCANDVSARDLQRIDGQWVRAKSQPTFTPLGPSIVPASYAPDPRNLGIQGVLNGVVVQDDRTCNMVNGIDAILDFLAYHFQLLPGDVILTGTPSGVGGFKTPPVFLKDGDEFEVHIEGVGRLRNVCQEGSP